MNNGGSRVLIPNNILKMIQDIKEITGKHSDDDIYATLKECNMDPNETAQRLLYLDTFHEVKKKRDWRKVNVNSRVFEESSWRAGSQGRGFRGGRGNYSSPYISHGGGGGRNASARKDNGVSYRMEKGHKASLTVQERAETNVNPLVTNSNILVNEPTRMSNGNSSHERNPQSSSGVYSVSNPVVVSPLNARDSGVRVIKGEISSPRNSAESGATDPVANRSNTAYDVANNISIKAVDKESLIVEKNLPSEPSQPSSLTATYGSLESSSVHADQSSQQLIGPFKVVASEAATLAVEAGSQSVPELNTSASEDATSKADVKIKKLNISAHQLVIFPEHLQVPEDFKNGLMFGSLDSTFEQCVSYANSPDDRKGSIPAPELLQENDKAPEETSLSNLSLSSTVQEGDYCDNPHSLPLVPYKSAHLEDNVSSGTAPKSEQSKQEIMFSQGVHQYPFVHIGPNYGFPFLQPMLGSQLVQCEGPESQSGNSVVSSTSASTPTATQPAGVGQSPIAVSPPQFPVLRHPYPPNYFPFGPYLPSFYLASNSQQFLGHSGLPQQPSTVNVYLAPPPPPPAPGVKFSVPQGKPGINTGNMTQYGVPSAYNSYSPGPAATSANSTGNEGIAASGLKNNVYTTVLQGEGPFVRLPASGRDILHSNAFYNHLPHGQLVAFPPPRAGPMPFSGIYHPTQTIAATSTAHPLL
ncbi:hypothetical protein U1Q18_023960 [Sarracenia purpurea var. burkii]